MLNKILALIQGFLGVIIVIAAWFLAEIPRSSPIDNNGLPMVNTPPPTDVDQVMGLIMVPGILATTLGIIQSFRRLRFSGWQVFLGICVVLTVVYIMKEHSFMAGYVRYYGPAYWLTVFGIAIFGVGIAQFRPVARSTSKIGK